MYLTLYSIVPFSDQQRSERADVFVRPDVGSIRRRRHVRHGCRHQVRRRQTRLEKRRDPLIRSSCPPSQRYSEKLGEKKT